MFVIVMEKKYYITFAKVVKEINKKCFTRKEEGQLNVMLNLTKKKK